MKNETHRRKQNCDLIVERAARMMVDEAGASVPMMLDRMLTYVAAQACLNDGSAKTAIAFRVMAQKIEDGLFHPVTGENQGGGKGH
tara:strand:+ start:6417 stop:6674 length:258 start_codon:yes stop_codon:yes gene_type:complete